MSSLLIWLLALAAILALTVIALKQLGLQSLIVGAPGKTDGAARRRAASSEPTVAERKATRRRWVAPALLVIALLGLGLFAYWRHPADQKTAQVASQPATPVETAIATETAWPSRVSIPGVVSAVDTANLASRAGGWVTKLLVNDGARVKKGDLLAEVGAIDVRSQVAQAAARLSTAQASYKQAAAQEERYRALNQKQFASTEQYQLMEKNFLAAKAELEAATRGLEAAQADLDYAEIRAPFAGIVAAKNAKQGDYVAPGATILVIAGDTPEIYAQAGPSIYDSLKKGEKATVLIDAKPMPAEITEIVAAADPQTHTHLVKLLLPEGASAPYGAYAEVRFSLGDFKALSIPQSALVERAGLLSVFVVGPDHRAHLRLVRIGETIGGRTSAVAGLKAGDQVILNPSPDLQNGDLVAPSAASGEKGVSND